MKKIVLPSKSMVLCAACVISFMFFSGKVFAEQSMAVITVVQNEVLVSTAPGSAWQKARKGMPCVKNTTIKTGANSYAELVYEDGSGARIEQNSKAVIQNLNKTDKVNEFIVNLMSGRLLNNVFKKSNKSNKYSVKTPTCVISVRGTVFVVDSSSSEAKVAVYEGSVAAEQPGKGNAGSEIQVKADMQVGIKENEKAAQPKPLDNEFADYRKNTADLFNKRIEYYRTHMEEVRKMYEDHMEAWRKETQGAMDKNSQDINDTMKEYRKKHGIKEYDTIPDSI